MVNRVYNVIKEDKNLGKDVKMIGIGLGFSPRTWKFTNKPLSLIFIVLRSQGRDPEQDKRSRKIRSTSPSVGQEQ